MGIFWAHTGAIGLIDGYYTQCIYTTPQLSAEKSKILSCY